MRSDKNANILIVEDNPDHAMIIEREFKKRIPGVAIDYVEGGEACLEKLTMKPYSAVVLDYSLPQMNGLEVLTKIVAECFDVPVIMISGQGNETIAASAIKGGAVDYIVKGPDYAPMLINATLSAIEKRSLKSTIEEKDAALVRKDRELATRDTELSRQDSLRNEFLAGVVHSLREPLVSIRGYSELLLNAKMGPVTEEQKRGLGVCLRNVDKLLAVIEDTVAFADASVPDHLNIRHLVLNGLLEDAVTTVLPKAISRRIKVSLDAPTESFRIAGDERKLSQAFITLLDLAIRATATDGTVKVRLAETEDGRIGVSFASTQTARGAFETLPSAEREDSAHAVARVNDIVSWHHGDCVVLADDARFEAKIRLPLQSRATLAEEQPPESVPAEGKLGTILIVDDDMDCLDLLSMILSRDFNTVAAKSGTRMFELLDTRPVDMILLDINMYDVNGIDACRRVKRDTRFANVPVYMISATLGEDKKLLSLEAGASGFIEKPFEMDTVLKFIKRVFPGGSRAGRTTQR